MRRHLLTSKDTMSVHQVLSGIYSCNVEQSFLSIMAPHSSIHPKIQIALRLPHIFICKSTQFSALWVKCDELHFPEWLLKAKHTYGNITIVMGHNHVAWKHKQETGYWGVLGNANSSCKMWRQISYNRLDYSCHLWTHSALHHETSAQKSPCFLTVLSPKNCHFWTFPDNMLNSGRNVQYTTTKDSFLHSHAFTIRSCSAILWWTAIALTSPHLTAFGVIDEEIFFVWRSVGHVVFLYFHWPWMMTQKKKLWSWQSTFPQA